LILSFRVPGQLSGDFPCPSIALLAFYEAMKERLKRGMVLLMGKTVHLAESLRKLYAFSHLNAQIGGTLDPSVLVLGRADVHGTCNISVGPRSILYRDLHLETRDAAKIVFGNEVLLARGVHITAQAGITIGEGTMVGEYTSIRDSNHARMPGLSLRESGHTAKPIVIGRNVWIGRSVAVLGGVSIGDEATVGANAVVTKDVAPGEVVVGIPAGRVRSRSAAEAAILDQV
jgi:acetyltransferase-like isoleucine patch superfamily enzyme